MGIAFAILLIVTICLRYGGMRTSNVNALMIFLGIVLVRNLLYVVAILHGDTVPCQHVAIFSCFIHVPICVCMCMYVYIYV